MEQLELFIYGECHSCDYIGYFHYIGTQEGYKHIPYIPLYNCEGCETTLSENSILENIVRY